METEIVVQNAQHTRMLPTLSGAVRMLYVAVAVPDQEDRMTVDVFVARGSRDFRWPLTAMQYIIIGEAIASMVDLPLDCVRVISVNPLAEGHTFEGETANELSLPERFYENNRPPYELFRA